MGWDWGPWCQPTTSGPQRGEQAKQRGLRWGEMASWGSNGTLDGNLPDAQGIAQGVPLGTAPTREAISAHQMGDYQ